MSPSNEPLTPRPSVQEINWNSCGRTRFVGLRLPGAGAAVSGPGIPAGRARR
jgi:hypothetical protein